MSQDSHREFQLYSYEITASNCTSTEDGILEERRHSVLYECNYDFYTSLLRYLYEQRSQKLRRCEGYISKTGIGTRDNAARNGMAIIWIFSLIIFGDFLIYGKCGKPKKSREIESRSDRLLSLSFPFPFSFSTSLFNPLNTTRNT